MVTDKEKGLVAFIESYLYIDFEGDFEDKEEVQEFINEYIDMAKAMYDELRCEYEAYLWD